MQGRYRLKIRSGFLPKTGHNKRGVEVLPNLGNYPIGYSPGVNPSNGAGRVAAFDEYNGPKGVNALRDEVESVLGSAGEGLHQELVRRWTMEPPLEVGGQ